MCVLHIFVSFCVLLLSASVSATEFLEITVPNDAWDGTHSVLCAAIKVTPDSFVQSFIPIRKPKTVRHISVAACDSELDTTKVWECKTPKEVCPGGHSDGLWAAAKDGPAWHLPKDYGFHIKENYNYVVVQVHAPVNMKLKNTTKSFDRLGIKLGITTKRPKYVAALALFGNVGYIPALTTGFTADAACNWPHQNTPLFAMSIHSHNMATAISGYIYRNGTFIELIRADPRYPEPIFNIDNHKIVMKEKDIMMMRCTLTNPTNHNVNFGFEHTDQMCNFMVWFGILEKYEHKYRPFVCGKNVQKFNLNNYNLPKDSNQPDVEGYKKRMLKFNVSIVSY